MIRKLARIARGRPAWNVALGGTVAGAFLLGHLTASAPTPAAGKTESRKGPKASIVLTSKSTRQVVLRADGRQRRKDPTKFDGVLGVRALPNTGAYELVVKVAPGARRQGATLRYEATLTGP